MSARASVAAPAISLTANDADATRAGEPRSPPRHHGPDLAALVMERSSLPWIELVVGEDRQAIARARSGQVVVLTAASGAGKSTLAIECCWRHAADVGPALYVSCELDAEEVGARLIGQRCGVSWEAALSGEVPGARDVVALPRLVVLEGDDARLEGPRSATASLAWLRSQYPDEPTLVVIDYVSILPPRDDGASRDERIRVAGIAEYIRRWAKSVGVVVLAVSQTSRETARKLRAGDITGADTASTGAESAQIERMAAVTIALGKATRRDDGADAVDLSIGKGRMGQGDRVIPMLFDGRTGSWRVSGPSVPGSDHRASTTAQRKQETMREVGDLIVGYLNRNDAPCSRKTVQAAIRRGRNPVLAAITALLASGEIVEVAGKRTGGALALWTTERATAAGIAIAPRGSR